jgi:putative membrane protein
MALKPFKSNRVLQAMILWLVAVWILAAINPLYPRDWLLENLLVIGWSALLVATYRRFQFSNVSYGLFIAFLSLHLAGSHYTYSETPFGFWMQDWFGFERNHYDRIVHFSFGLLIAYPMREILLRTAGLNIAWSYFITLNCIMAFSAIYEVIEAITAVVVSPELGAAYLGTQGDEWDAQKDGGLAFLGSMVAMSITWAWLRMQRGNSART